MSVHAPDHKPINADFGCQPGEGGVGDGMFFAKRPKRADGMFYSADGAGKSTAAQDTDVEAEKIDHALDDLTDLQHKTAYANILKEATFSSAAKGGAVGALVGAAAGFAGGKAVGETSDEERARRAERARAALERAKGSEAGKALGSARDTIGHIGRAGANAAGAVKNEIDKRASDAAFDDLEKTAGFLSLPSKAGVGKAVLRGLGYGGLGVGALGVAAGGKSPLVDMQTGSVNPDAAGALKPVVQKGVDAMGGAPATSDGGQDAQINRLAEARRAKAQPTPAQLRASRQEGLRAGQVMEEWKANPKSRQKWEADQRRAHGAKPLWKRFLGKDLPDKGAGKAYDPVPSEQHGGGKITAGGNSPGGNPQETAAAEALAEAKGGGVASSGKRLSSGEPISAADQQRREASDRAPVEDRSGVADADWQGPPLPAGYNADGTRKVTPGDLAAAQARYGGMGDAAEPFEDRPGGPGAAETETTRRGPGRPSLNALARGAGLGDEELDIFGQMRRGDISADDFHGRLAKLDEPAAQEAKKAPAATPPPKKAPATATQRPSPPLRPAVTAAETLGGPVPPPTAQAAAASAPYGIETGRSRTPRTTGLPPGAQYAVDNDLPLTRDEERLRGAPAPEPGIAGPGAMVAGRGKAPPAPTGKKVTTDMEAMAETRFGDEIDREYPGLDPKTRRQMLQMVAQQGGLPGDVGPGKARMQPGGMSVANVSPGLSATGRTSGFDPEEHQRRMAELEAQGTDTGGPAGMVARR